jgi:probable blue pigment (indigoidine) exporter
MTRYRTLGLFALLATIWGLSFVASRSAVQTIPPLLLAALRFDIAGLLMLGYAVLTTNAWRPRTRADWVGIGLGGTFFIAAHHALLYAGQQYVTSVVAGVVISVDPILAAVFARIFLPDEQFSLLSLIGFGCGILGVGIIVNPTPSHLVSADSLGVILVVLAAAAFALGAVLTKRFRPELPVQSMQAWMMLLGAFLLHGVSFISPAESLATIHWTDGALLGLGYLAIVAGGMGYLLYFELLDRLGPVEINLIGYAAPGVAALGGWVLLGEQLAGTTVIGFCSILIGFGLIKRNALQEEFGDIRRLMQSITD